MSLTVGIFQKGFDRSEPNHLIDDFLGEGLRFFLVQRQMLGADVLRQISPDFSYQVRDVEVFPAM